jgi:phage tail-like protein
MPFSNREYLFEHVPARFRRDDAGEFLNRFLTFVGETLDGWDESFAGFHLQIAPATAGEEFIDWWLWALFGWAWFPEWYTLAEKRAFYAQIATLYAQRGTALGIERMLKAFGVHSRVSARPQYWGEFVWGEGGYTVDRPLAVLVEIKSVDDRVNPDAQFWGQLAWGEGNYYRPVVSSLRKSEIESLLRFEQPLGQAVAIGW